MFTLLMYNMYLLNVLLMPMWKNLRLLHAFLDFYASYTFLGGGSSEKSSRFESWTTFQLRPDEQHRDEKWIVSIERITSSLELYKNILKNMSFCGKIGLLRSTSRALYRGRLEADSKTTFYFKLMKIV